MASAKVTILNHLTAMCRGIGYIRDMALGSISEESLVDLIQNHDVTPTRGDRRKTRKPRKSTKGRGAKG